MSRFRPWGWWGVLALLAGCRVGPDYHAPQPAVPASWNQRSTREVTSQPPPVIDAWWKNLADPELNALMDRALQSNRDLAVAAARVRAARALRGAVASDLLPTIGTSASYTTARRSANALAFPVQLLDTETYQVGFDASWELDVFGGKSRALQAATADLQGVEADRRAVLFSVEAEVARQYLELRGAQTRLRIAHQNREAQQEVVAITQLRRDQGLSSELEVAQAQALLASTEAQVPTLDTELRRANHRLCVLLGQAPGSLDAEFAPESRPPGLPPEVPAGLPADLLRRRPDVRRSERQLAAATARIGVVQAELFPKFYLTGNGGYQSLGVENLVSPDSKFWSAGPSVRWRILEYPRLRSQIKAQTAQQEAALAQFEQTVLLALEEVENALVAYGRERERQASLRTALEASRRSLDLANQLYLKGLGEFLDVLISQRAVYQAEDALAQSERTVTVNLVALYKALGGGWDPEAERP